MTPAGLPAYASLGHAEAESDALGGARASQIDADDSSPASAQEAENSQRPSVDHLPGTPTEGDALPSPSLAPASSPTSAGDRRSSAPVFDAVVQRTGAASSARSSGHVVAGAAAILASAVAATAVVIEPLSEATEPEPQRDVGDRDAESHPAEAMSATEAATATEGGQETTDADAADANQPSPRESRIASAIGAQLSAAFLLAGLHEASRELQGDDNACLGVPQEDPQGVKPGSACGVHVEVDESSGDERDAPEGKSDAGQEECLEITRPESGATYVVVHSAESSSRPSYAESAGTYSTFGEF